jgi:Methyl-accepting chemotaxis protein (MCP) signalling domain/Cache domain
MLSTFKTNFQSKFNNLSFKTKALATVVLLSLLPVLGVGSLAYVVSYNNLQTAETDAQQSDVLALSNAIDRFIALRGKDIQTIADSPVAKDAKISKSLTLAAKEDFLNSYIDRYKIYDSLMFLDTSGNILAASKGSSRENHSNRDYFQATIKSGKPQISKVEISKTTKKSSIYFTAPIKDSITGQIVGIVRARMPLTALNEIAAPYAANNSEWLIIEKDTNKVVLAHTDHDIGRSVAKIESYQQLGRSDKAFSGNSKDENTGNQELISFANVTTKQDLGNLNLAVGSIKDLKNIQTKENAILAVLLVGMLITGGTTIGLSLLLGSRVTKFIKQLADSIVSSSGAIVDTVEMQEVTVNMQANSAIDTSATVNELGAISFQSAAQAEASANGARQALSLSEDGTRSVQQTLQGMSGLRDKVDAIANQIVNLSEQTGQITVVSDLVADLASQTNMLALNAAVEAARAGEQGKGFSVVADEIRKLADQSKKSADKINALANDIQAAINRTVMVTDEGTKTVNEGIDLARSTAATFAGVTDAVNNVFLNSQQISTSAKQQAISIQQVLTSMTTISQGSQESAVGMHQVKMTTRELTQVADELKAAVV